MFQKLWGEPKSKIELQAKRQDLWLYSHANVLFGEGEVKAWGNNVDENGNLIAPRQEAMVETSASSATVDSGKAQASGDVTLEDILTEVMEDTADSEDKLDKRRANSKKRREKK